MGLKGKETEDAKKVDSSQDENPRGVYKESRHWERSSTQQRRSG